jgi:hypothetical protein
MKWLPVLSAVLLAWPLAAQEKEDQSVRGPLVADGSSDRRAPVLRGSEPTDSLVFTLPGTPPAALPPPSLPPTIPDQEPEDDHRPLLRRAPKPVLPVEFERDSALFCQKLIGLWSEPDAYNLFGDPLRDRVVLDPDGMESGRILAYSDPTGRYREIELDFAHDTGVLRTVFVYPWKLTWLECRKRWGSDVRSTEANKGRIFHSYLNRHLDVLVDPAGHVISLGLY